MGKTAFVTGGTGFVGSHLVEELQKRDYAEIRCLVRSEPKWLAGLDVQYIRGTLEDERLIRESIQGVDFIYHVGALTRAPTWKMLYDANVSSTIQLITNAATASVTKICIVSSLAVVGNSGVVMADESTPCHPVSGYGRSKLLMEQALGAVDLPVVILRPPVVYGPRDRDLLSFFSAVNRRLCVVPRGNPGLSLIYVNDLVRGIIEATESPETTGETYFIANQEITSWRMLKDAAQLALGKNAQLIQIPRFMIMPLGVMSEFIGKMFGMYPPLNREKAREILLATIQCSSQKALDDFGYSSRISLNEGVQETLAWYQEHGWLKK